MKRIIILLLAINLNANGMKVITHFSNDSEGGVSIEKDIAEYKKLSVGVGATWNEVNESDYNRTFPVYTVGRYKLEKGFYAVGRVGATFDDSYQWDSKFLESGIGYSYNPVFLEIAASHQRGENQVLIKFGYDI